MIKVTTKQVHQHNKRQQNDATLYDLDASVMSHKKLLGRLIPAANATALVAAISHVASLTYVTGYLGVEGMYVAFLTYLITFVVVIPFGAVLLGVVGLFNVGLTLSLGLFLIAAQFAVLAISTLLFGFEPKSIPLQYAYSSVPAALIAWYFSVYHVWRKDRNDVHT
ncbi:hypothetical protein CBP31_00880 [Oceanisphaera profunda]|uniref:Uncharacterized protein n=1 Tax=Oceanisphaera profunda TaxID=1416627 RepID=A0A1Y0D208_9GAMM|nr:hypothetical protein [Oceanisphaera profunda]ART81364.1 hypothetical protein CBP31_00880 [Oceanisphaera profunda]